MCGTVRFHVIVRFFTVKNKSCSVSAAWTLAFIAVVYLTAPAVGAFARGNLIESLNEKAKELPVWFAEFETDKCLGR